MNTLKEIYPGSFRYSLAVEVIKDLMAEEWVSYEKEKFVWNGS